MANSKDYNAKYWQEHKEEISERRKKLYRERKGEIDERNKRWLDANRDKWNAYMRERRRKAKLDRSKDIDIMQPCAMTRDTKQNITRKISRG